MAIAQFIVVKLKVTDEDLKLQVQNVHLAEGKFYDGHDRYGRISTNQVNGIMVKYDQSQSISSCGTDGSSGTQGSFDIYDYAFNTKIGTFSWEFPWGSRGLKFKFSKNSDNYSVDANESGYNEIEIIVRKNNN